uniref:NCOA7 n=1 Tax=Steinernema glaseri TaxID=37863 RepID=A0A1I8A5M6_9BILA
MQDKCYSVIDMQTELRHTLWQWLYRATEIVMDVGHKICPSPAAIEKKGSKTKKQMAAAEDYQTMLSLFNNRHITMLSMDSVETVFHNMEKQSDEVNRVILMRFCEDNAGFLSFAFSNVENTQEGKPLFGSISCEQVKDFKQGLPEVLMDEPFPKNFDRIGKFEQPMCGMDVLPTFTSPKKKMIFHNYRTLRMQNEGVLSQDRWKTRVNPLTGERQTMREKSVTPPSCFSGALDNLPPLSEQQIKEFMATPGKSDFSDNHQCEDLPVSIPNHPQESGDANCPNDLLAVMAFLAHQGGLPLNIASQLTQGTLSGENQPNMKVDTGGMPVNLPNKNENSLTNE